MKLEKDNMNDKIILTLSEREYLMVLHSLKAATGDDSRRGLSYFNFYTADKGEIVALHNEIDSAERNYRKRG